MAAAASNSSQKLYTFEFYGHGYLIKVRDSSRCDFYGEKYLTIASNDTFEIVAFWNEKLQGWVVKPKDADYG